MPKYAAWPERHDARVAEDQVEREREEAGDQDLAAEHAMLREDEERRDGDEPERDLDRAQAIVRQMGARVERGDGGRAHAFRPYRPAGNRIISTTIRK
jgi:hypothetical protein